MAHWAEVNENNVVIRVTVGDNNDPAGDEGYSWLINNLGGRWIKCSYNTFENKHTQGRTPLRWYYPGIGYVYLEEYDAFMPPKEYDSWVLDQENYIWIPPIPVPDSGMWEWDEDTVSWIEK